MYAWRFTLTQMKSSSIQGEYFETLDSTGSSPQQDQLKNFVDIGHLAFAMLLVAAVSLHLYNLGHLYISMWDESVHAVVAEHLALHPLHPTLYEIAALSPHDADWRIAHTWLHIPPFGLLMSALSMTILGDTPLALRVPGVLFIAIGMLATYLLGRRLYHPVVGLIGAAVVGFSPYLTLLAQGYVFGDVTDTPLIALTPLFILALVTGAQTRRLRWYALSGACLGLCYLTKGALGIAPLAVTFALFAANWLAPVEQGWRRVHVRGLVAQFCAAGTIIAPYIIYTARAFPTTTAIERAVWKSALFTDLEHWGRPWDYHMTMYLYGLYGQGLALLLAASVGALAVSAVWRRSRADLVLIVWIVALYLPLSLAVTKPSPATLPAMSALGLACGRAVWLGLRSQSLLWRVATLGLLSGTSVMIVLVLTHRLGIADTDYSATVPDLMYPIRLKVRLTPYLEEGALCVLCTVMWLAATITWHRVTRPASKMLALTIGAVVAASPKHGVGPKLGARPWHAALSRGVRTLVNRARQGTTIVTLVVACSAVLAVGVYWMGFNLQAVGARPTADPGNVPQLGQFLDDHLPANATVLMDGDNSLVRAGKLNNSVGRLQLMFWAHRDVYAVNVWATGQLSNESVCPLKYRAEQAGSPLIILTEHAYNGKLLGTYAGWSIYRPSCP